MSTAERPTVGSFSGITAGVLHAPSLVVGIHVTDDEAELMVQIAAGTRAC